MMSDDQVLNESQRDALQELGNVAMGSAADSLARQFELFVSLSIPTVTLAQSSSELFAAHQGAGELVCCGHQALTLGAIEGVAGVIIAKDDLQQLAALQASGDDHQALLQRVTELVAVSASNAMADMLGGTSTLEPAQVLAQQAPAQLLASLPALVQQPSVLSINMAYQFENQAFEAECFLIFSAASVAPLIQALEQILAD